MMKNIKVGDKIKQIKEIGMLNRIGDIFTVNNIDGDNVEFICSYGTGIISASELCEYFEMVNETVQETEILTHRYNSNFEDIKIIKNKSVTVAILESGEKGVSKCMPCDEYSEEKGVEIALCKALIKHYSKELKKLIK